MLRELILRQRVIKIKNMFGERRKIEHYKINLDPEGN